VLMPDRHNRLGRPRRLPQVWIFFSDRENS
jgi:hypothetical protein